MSLERVITAYRTVSLLHFVLAAQKIAQSYVSADKTAGVGWFWTTGEGGEKQAQAKNPTEHSRKQ